MSADDDRPGDDPAALVALARPATSPDPASGESAARELRKRAVVDGDVETALQAGAWLCTHIVNQGRRRDALDEAAAVLAQVRAAPASERVDAARFDLLRTIAYAGSEAGDFSVALAAAQELAADPIVHADARAAYDAAFSLAVCLERMGDSWQALRVLADVLERHPGATGSFERLIVLNGVAATAIGAFHRVNGTGDDDEAGHLLAVGRDAAEKASRLVDEFATPAYRIAVAGNLGEVLAYQGELARSAELLAEALAVAEEIGATAHRDRVRASQGEWLVLSKQYDEALALCEELLTAMGPDGPHSTRIRAHHTAYLAARAMDRPLLALSHFEIWERLERIRTTGQLRSQSEMYVMKSEADAAVEHHRYSAERDPLTGVGNRRRFDREAATVRAAAETSGDPYAIAVIDVDHFKTINDEHGHAIGDEVLVELARLLQEQIRDGDVVVRHGGEEFVLLLPRADIERAAQIAERIRRSVSEHSWPAPLDDMVMTVSVGVAAAPPFDTAELLGNADQAMFDAKRAGRNLVTATTVDTTTVDTTTVDTRTVDTRTSIDPVT